MGDPSTVDGYWVPVAETQAKLADVLSALEQARTNLATLIESKGRTWHDGYEAGVSMSHSLGCDAVEGERDALRVQLEQARTEVASLQAKIDTARERHRQCNAAHACGTCHACQLRWPCPTWEALS
jgi:chromosome segregation ATPase